MKPITAICLLMLVTAPAPAFAEDMPYPDFGSITKTAGPLSQASAPLKTQAPLSRKPVPTPPAPLPTKIGCYHYRQSGWVEVGCATQTYIKEHLPRHDTIYWIYSLPQGSSPPFSTVPLGYGSIDITFNAVGSISDNKFGTNAFSIQLNTGLFTGNNSDQDLVQFVDGSQPGQPDLLCIEPVDWTTGVDDPSLRSCMAVPNARAGGIAAGDEPIVQGFVLPSNRLGILGYFPWAEGGASQPYYVVGPDYYDLTDNWSEVSGSVIGFGNGSGLTFSYADIWTRIAASNCLTTDPTAPLTSCPSQSGFMAEAATEPSGTQGTTQEYNNLVSPAVTPTLTRANPNLALIDYPEMVAIPGCNYNNMTQCVAETGSNASISETTYTATCSSGLSMQRSNNGEWLALPQHCSDGSSPGTCSPSAIVPNEFVLGTQSNGISLSGGAIGTTQTVRVCNGAQQCTPFTLPVPQCPSPNDQFYAGNLWGVTQGAGGGVSGMLFMYGPWVAADNGVNATGRIMAGLPQGCTASLSPGYRITSGGVQLLGGFMEMILYCPLSASPGTYTATVTATDVASNVTRTTNVAIQVLPCMPGNWLVRL